MQLMQLNTLQFANYGGQNVKLTFSWDEYYPRVAAVDWKLLIHVGISHWNSALCSQDNWRASINPEIPSNTIAKENTLFLF